MPLTRSCCGCCCVTLAVFDPVIQLAWTGLQRAIHEDGYVVDICDGFGRSSSSGKNMVSSVYFACTKAHALAPRAHC